MDFAQQLFSDDPKTEIIEQITERMSTIKRKMTDIKDQIVQTQQMVEREQQRYSDIATELNTVDANLDKLPREDIRDKYREALDVRFRLTTMRGTLEKFESNYEYLETEQKLLSEILGKLQGVEVFGTDEEEALEGDATDRNTANIIRIVQAQEEERQRLARQMHDGPAQSLTNFILQAEICQRLFNRNPEKAAEELNNLKTAASVTFQKVRDFIFDLRPMMLDDLGVIPTIRRWVDSFREKNDIEVELEIIGEERRMESHREVMIFRSIQEVMGHARDYASPTKIKLKLDTTGNATQILIHDDGRSFEADIVMEGGESQDARIQGLLSLKERFELVKGSLTVTSNETEGTLVRLELPNN
ncbi:MAG: sensor histidine kinase [Phototrophicales bacterium]